MPYSVAIAGASGYAGGEVLRLLADHPELEVRTVTAHANAGQPLLSVHPHLRSYAGFEFVDTTAANLAGHDVVFLALPHGASAAVAAELSPGTLVIDAGADHRLESAADWEAFYKSPHAGTWEYGVPELPRAQGPSQRERLAGAKRIAAPGCNASTVALSLAPGIHAGVIEPVDIVSVLAVGPSGAGRSLRPDLLATEILGSANPYSVGGTHRHIPEIQQALRWAGATEVTLSFTPMMVPMARGILAVSTARIAPGVDAASVRAAWSVAYAGEPFVQLLPAGQVPKVADVTGANTILLGVVIDEAVSRVTVVAAVDNLVKGTAGAAIQSANLALGLPETLSLPVNGVAP